MLRQPLFWSGCLSIQFFNSNTLVSDLRDAMPRQRSLTRTHMWLTGRHAMPEVTLHIPHPPCHPSLSRGLSPGFYTHFILSAQPSAEWFATYPHHPFFLPWALRIWERVLFIPREVEDFFRGDKHFKHIPPPTYLIYLSPKDLYR